MKSKTIAALTAHGKPCIRAIISSEDSDDGRDHILKNMSRPYGLNTGIALVEITRPPDVNYKVMDISHDYMDVILKALNIDDLRAIYGISHNVLMEMSGIHGFQQWEQKAEAGDLIFKFTRNSGVSDCSIYYMDGHAYERAKTGDFIRLRPYTYEEAQTDMLRPTDVDYDNKTTERKYSGKLKHVNGKWHIKTDPKNEIKPIIYLENLDQSYINHLSTMENKNVDFRFIDLEKTSVNINSIREK